MSSSGSDSEGDRFISIEELQVLRKRDPVVSTLTFDADLRIQFDAELEERVRDMRYPKSFHWLEKLTVMSSRKIDDTVVDNDKERELQFQRQGMEAAKKARSIFKKLGERFERPPDYFAEMIKADEHMLRVRKLIIEKADNIQKSMDAKKQRELKKNGKQIQTQILQTRAKEKTASLKRIKSLRKNAKNVDTEFDVGLDYNSSTNGKSAYGKKAPVNHKRNSKDAKYGFGGKRDKRNTAEGAKSSSEFNPKFNRDKSMGGSKLKKATNKKSTSSRPGKAIRNATKRK